MSEIEEIRRKYESGELDGLKRDLERFLASHRDRIRQFREAQSAPMGADLAVKFYILKHRTVNPQGDIAEQLREIEKEKWIRGVNTGRVPDPQDVAVDWAKRYSAAWRAHRVTTIVYVFEREKEQYLKLLG